MFSLAHDERKGGMGVFVLGISPGMKINANVLLTFGVKLQEIERTRWPFVLTTHV